MATFLFINNKFLLKICVCILILIQSISTRAQNNTLRRYDRVQNRIIGGQKAAPGQIPYQVLLRIHQIQCGGSIITKNLVITAAHCVMYPKRTAFVPSWRITLFAGHTNRLSKDMKTFSVADYTYHGSFDPYFARNDIAILRIDGTFWDNLETSRYIRPIPISPTSIPDGTPCVISGWGSIDTKSNTLTQDLYYTTVRIFSHSICKSRYLGYKIDSSMLCATAQGVDSCQGDSGGPLACNINGTDYLAGVISWGLDCASDYYPGVYVDLVHFRSWINTNVGSTNYSLNLYHMLFIVIIVLGHPSFY